MRPVMRQVFLSPGESFRDLSGMRRNEGFLSGKLAIASHIMGKREKYWERRISNDLCSCWRRHGARMWRFCVVHPEAVNLLNENGFAQVEERIGYEK